MTQIDQEAARQAVEAARYWEERSRELEARKNSLFGHRNQALTVLRKIVDHWNGKGVSYHWTDDMQPLIDHADAILRTPDARVEEHSSVATRAPERREFCLTASCGTRLEYREVDGITHYGCPNCKAFGHFPTEDHEDVDIASLQATDEELQTLRKIRESGFLEKLLASELWDCPGCGRINPLDYAYCPKCSRRYHPGQGDECAPEDERGSQKTPVPPGCDCGRPLGEAWDARGGKFWRCDSCNINTPEPDARDERNISG